MAELETDRKFVACLTSTEKKINDLVKQTT